MSLFHKNKEPAESSEQSSAIPKQLNGDSTVSEWLEHPAGGEIFRDILREAGQNESVLRPVRRLSMNRLVKMSKGRFTDAMLADMIDKANNADLSATEKNNLAQSEKSTERAAEPWQEKISDGRFIDKTIIVTGAGSGIGRATASRIAREGGRVIAVDISRERLDELRTELPNSHIELVVADISKHRDISQIIEVAGEQIDGLANVAGIMDNMTPLHEVSDEIWERVMLINLNGMMLLSRAALPKMLQQNRGSIVNVGSEASLKGSVAGAAYTTSKHAVVGLSKSMAFMYGPSGIRTNVVAPGAVLTNIEAKFESELGSERVNGILATMPDAAESAELAAVITYLLSDDAVNINGAILPSDGGWSVQ